MRSVIVTGGSRGIGLSIAARLAGSGYRAIAVARHQTEALSAAAEAAGRGALVFRPFDLSDTGNIPGFARALAKEFGPVYGLVNNAAIGISGVLASTQNAAIERAIRLNTLSPILLSKYVVRAMMAAGEGRIVNVASIVGATGFSGLSVYGATKAAMVGFTRSLARELGALNITVNAIAPGFVDTQMTASLSEEQREQVVRRSALRRLAGAEDVASAVEFLFSDKASNITGTVLTVDAGSTA